MTYQLPRNPKTLPLVSLLLLATSVIFCGCATVKMPPGQENKRVFTQESDTSYGDAFKIIAKQMRACYRGVGLLGNGQEVQAVLDSSNQTGTIEVYYVGLTGAQPAESTATARTVTIFPTPTGSTITTKGTTPELVYLTHRTIPLWLSGTTTCYP